MKNVLIYIYKSQLRACGGPKGYNYNLYLQLEKMGVNNIHFLDTGKGDETSINNKVNSIKNKYLRYIVIIIKSIVKKWMMLYSRHNHAVVNLDDYDIVHFHSTKDLYCCKDDLKKYKGKVVLTNHSPTLLSKEMFAYLTPWEQKHMKWFFKKMIRFDEYAFERADYVIFPCEEAEEPYYNNWDRYADFRNKNSYKIKHLLTGIVPAKVCQARSEVRVKNSIPDNAFVISYIGRHNELKGYDRLLRIGEKLLENENVYILVAGKEEPLKGLKHNRWIEVGWTNDPHSYIAASDCFLLPNKETYFDLVMLEVLSLGQIVIASNTGGNKYFERLKPNGVILFNDEEDAIHDIKKIMDMSQEEREKLKMQNKSLFEKYFTSNIFAKKYIGLLDSL